MRERRSQAVDGTPGERVSDLNELAGNLPDVHAQIASLLPALVLQLGGNIEAVLRHRVHADRAQQAQLVIQPQRLTRQARRPGNVPPGHQLRSCPPHTGQAARRDQAGPGHIGCGNGAYLAELARRQHAGKTMGVDLSAGMLRAARARAGDASLLAGDAAALPLAGGCCDVALAIHMLYHVPSPQDAVRELHRVARQGGRVVVVLNGGDHLRELRELISAALADIGAARAPAARFERIRLDRGQELLSEMFTTVVRHDFVSELLLPDTEPVADYVRSTFLAQALPDPQRLAAAVTSRLAGDPDDAFRVRTHSGCLVCS